MALKVALAAFAEPLLKRLYKLHNLICAFAGEPASAQAIVMTPEGRVVLVRHSYRNGWHLPERCYAPAKERRTVFFGNYMRRLACIPNEHAMEGGLCTDTFHGIPVARPMYFRSRT